MRSAYKNEPYRGHVVLSLFFLLSLSIMLTGCEDDPPAVKTCFEHIQCDVGEICYFGKCQAGCQGQSDCPVGLVCLSNGLCQAEDTCINDADCCVGQPLGQCTTSCVNNSCVGSACEGSSAKECYQGCHKGSQVCVDGFWSGCDAPELLEEEICGDGIDNDCFQGIDDGCDPCETGGKDLEEVCGDGIDNDCDGVVDEDCDLMCIPGDEKECDGPCGPGMTLCQEDQTWGPCESEESCDCEPGVESLLPCGNCGQGLYQCNEEGVDWVLTGECLDEGVCQPGEESVETCGKCGTVTRVCEESCTWGEPTGCVGEVGICEPGDRETETCGLCGIKEKECSDSCEWGEFGECTGQGECTPGEEDDFDCGKCGTRTAVCSIACEWDEPGDCYGQGECNPGDSVKQDCDLNFEQEKVCSDECSWGEFGACEPVVDCGPGEFLCPQAEGCCSYSSGGCEESDDPYCPGCICANCVCQVDSFCCSIGWDGVCVSKCESECGGCGTFNDGCQTSNLSSTSDLYSHCDDGSVEPVSGHCYKAFTGFQNKDWNAAQSACEQWGGYLATINSANENAFVKDLTNCSKTWLGLTDSVSEGAFIWVDGNPLAGPFIYSNWEEGEPNNKSGEDCVQIYSDGKWNDEGCGDSYCYVCEKNLQLASGCDGCACESCVCAMDEFCCNNAWDGKCVEECAFDCGGCGYKGCEALTGPGCDGCPCQECVCAQDSYCCDIKWDNLCADKCVQDCGGCEALPSP